MGDFRAAEPSSQLAGEIRCSAVALVIATLRADGSPRVSASVVLDDSGGVELAFGSMPARAGRRPAPGPAVRAARRPPTSPAATWEGGLKVAAGRSGTGRCPAPSRATRSGRPHRSGVDGLNDERNRLVVRWWTPSAGLRSVERE
ncbi:pyridoxamine 5-phosphate oxidase [Pseudonocardia sp. MCCB 268]|nr:pyridoxamine 5-phosphate oxidase [Pseudonocardia cytotoxica]